MTKQETVKLLYVIRATYPKQFQSIDNEDIANMAEAWAFHLADFTMEQVSLGLKVYCTSNDKGFMPSPGQIIECYRKTLARPEDEMTAAEAWEYVWKALENLRWDMPELAFNQLPRKIQKVIGTASGLKEMAMMNSTDVLIGEKARFIHAYDAYTEKENDYLRLPQKVRDRIELNAPKTPVQIAETKVETKAETESVPVDPQLMAQLRRRLFESSLNQG